MAQPLGGAVIEALLYATERQVAAVLVELLFVAAALCALGKALTRRR